MNSLTHSFNILGSIDRDRYCDVKLVTECGSSISAHKVILGAVSKKLSAKFEKSSGSEIKVRNVRIETLTKVIDFVYERKVKISNKTEMSDFFDCFTILNMYLGPKFNSVIKKINMNSDSSEKGSQEDVFKCEDCLKTFVSQKQVSRHRREVHRETKEKLVYICENCEEEYTVSLHVLLIFCRRSYSLDSKGSRVLQV